MCTSNKIIAGIIHTKVTKMTDIVTWQALGVDVYESVGGKKHQIIYTQHDNGKIIGWYGSDSSSEIDKILSGLKLQRIEATKQVDGWILLGTTAIEFWPSDASNQTITKLLEIWLMRTFAVDEILNDKEKKLEFWQNWKKFWLNIAG